MNPSEIKVNAQRKWRTATVKARFTARLVLGVSVVAVLTGALTASPANAATAMASPASSEACWSDQATGNWACASSQQALAEKIFVKFNLLIKGDSPAALKLTAAKVAQLSTTRTDAEITKKRTGGRYQP